IITWPAIRMNHTFRTNFTSYNALKRLFSGIRDNLGIYFSLPLEHAKDNGFARSSSSSFAWDPSGTKLGLIDFNGSSKRSFLLAPSGNFNPQFIKDHGNRSQRNRTQLGRFCSG